MTYNKKESEGNKPQNHSEIIVIGVDASGLDNISLEKKRLLIGAQRIAAPKRLLKNISDWWEINSINKQLPERHSTDKTQEFIKWIKQSPSPIIVIASGDPLWFGIGRILLETFPNKKIEFHPSPTSMQIAFARINRPWQDATWISLHGRDPFHLAKVLKKRPKALAILTDPNRGGAKEVKRFLQSSGLENNYSFWIFERLGAEDERIQKVLPQQEIPNSIDPLHLVLIISENKLTINSEELPLFGIEDGLFLQQSDYPGLMTKREARIQVIADLELPSKGIIWDLCAGVGSIGLEALRVRPALKLMAVEKKIGSARIIKENASRLCVSPKSIIEQEALQLIKSDLIPPELNQPERIILSGGGSYRKDLLIECLKRIKPGGIIVIPLATLQALNELEVILKSTNCSFSFSQHQSYRGVNLAGGTRLSPMNPIFILKVKISKSSSN